MKWMALLLLIPALCFGQSGNTIEFSRLSPGQINYMAYDGYNDTNTGASILIDFSRFVYENSYGRNWLVWNISANCGELPRESYVAPNSFFYNITCTNVFPVWRWNYNTIRHETGHDFGAGEGSSWDCCVKLLDYGDEYDPQGHYTSTTGHWCAPHKEVMGFIGPFGLRPFTLVTNSGSHYITDIQSQSQGSKAIKILHKRWLYKNNDGSIIYDIRTFYYLEVRANHKITTTSGKGRKKRTSISFVPAVQIRECSPVYTPERWRVQSKFRTDLGKSGGFLTGGVFSDREVFEEQVPFQAGVTNYGRSFTITVNAVTADGATVSVFYQ